jgi:hypothetical protein
LFKPVQPPDDRRFALTVSKLAQPVIDQVFTVWRQVVP